jgi:hypothetical protein
MLILEVLGGQRTPSEAATALGVSTTRYYGLETQALEGLIGACERRGRGPRRSLDKELERLEREVKRLEKECARRQTLLRLSQRALGVVAPSRTEPKGKEAAGDKGKRRRNPKRATARALQAAAHIEKSASAEPAPWDPIELPAGGRDDKSR